jgi:hypothetical protein
VGWSEIGANSITPNQVIEARRRAAPPFHVRELGWINASLDLHPLFAGESVYVVITDYFSSGDWDPETIQAWGNINASRAPARRGYLQDLFDRTEVVRVYRPRELRSLGPTVTLLSVKQGV